MFHEENQVEQLAGEEAGLEDWVNLVVMMVLNCVHLMKFFLTALKSLS